MLSAERNVNDGFTPDEEAVPQTPPPSYSSISRQISAASTISQSSQQREFTLYSSAAILCLCSTGGICFCLVCHGFCLVPNIFLLLRNNTERILIKFAAGSHYY